MLKSFSDRKVDENKIAQEGRFPPGQSLTNKFPVMHYGPTPDFNPANWDFRVYGEVKEDLILTWDKFNELPRTRLEMDIHCVTRWSKFETTWEGVAVRTLIDRGLIKPKESASHVMQHAEYGYSTNLPLDIVLADNFLLATHFNGEPLTPDHGFPLRGVMGHIHGRDNLKTVYFWKGAKWLRSLEFMPQDRLGFWENAGYHNEGEIWQEQRFS